MPVAVRHPLSPRFSTQAGLVELVTPCAIGVLEGSFEQRGPGCRSQAERFMSAYRRSLRSGVPRRGAGFRTARLEKLEDRLTLSTLLGNALVVFQDDFAGPAGAASTSVPEVDLQRAGWQNGSPASQISGTSQLISGGAGSFATATLFAPGPTA